MGEWGVGWKYILGRWRLVDILYGWVGGGWRYILGGWGWMDIFHGWVGVGGVIF